ncbi:MAG: hypothetical protein KAY21_02240 [Limnohabitans sp.]|nr:hypothetical protein [Limnohabitans sp.]
MGIALLALSGLFNGLSSLNRAATAVSLPLASQPVARRLRPVWPGRHATCTPATQRPTPLLPLRVLRVAEAGQRTAGAGRMVISGRMADVCAELDRLAALEAAQARH